VYVGLPDGTAQSLEKLWKQGKIGLELSTEFDASVLIGVYPLNPAKEHLNGNGNGHAEHHHEPMEPLVPIEAALDLDTLPEPQEASQS
jgi:hypothetical protein